jgi:hypothetical protein
MALVLTRDETDVSVAGQRSSTNARASGTITKLAKTIPVEDAWRPLDQGGYSFVGKKECAVRPSDKLSTNRSD